MRCLLMLLAGASCLAAPTPRLAPDPARAVSETWGERIRVAFATFTKADDVELAREMLAAAESKKTPPELAAAIADRAADLAARDPSGYATAIKCLDLAIARTNEDAKRQDYLERGITLRERNMAGTKGEDRARIAAELVTMRITAGQSRLAAADTPGTLEHFRKALAAAASLRDSRADPLRAAIDVLVARQRFEGELKRVTAALSKAPGDQRLIDQLVQLCMVDLDDPAAARAVLPNLTDPDARGLLTLAARPVGTLTEAESKEVARAYLAFAEKAGPDAKAAMFARAQAAYGIYIVRHGEKDADGRAARLELNKIDAALAGLPVKPAPLNPPSAAARNLWRELNADLNQAPQWTNKGGTWLFVDGRIRGRGDSRIVFKRPLPADFTLELKMNVLDGRRPRLTFTGLDFAVGSDGPTQTIGIHGDGVTAIKGSPVPYFNGKEISVTIVCSGQEVAVHVNGNAPITGKRKLVKECELELRAGDNWSAGTTDFYDFRLSAVAKEK